MSQGRKKPTKRPRVEAAPAAAAAAAAPPTSAAAAAAPPTNEPVLIGVYNYKGGAGKTTTALNLASVMAHMHKKSVLVVDCDPQCNLTSFMFPDPARLDEPDLTDVDDTDDEGDDDATLPSSPLPSGELPHIMRDEVTEGLETLSPEVIRKGYSECNCNLYEVMLKLAQNGLVDAAVLRSWIDKLPKKSLSPDIDPDSDDNQLYLIPGDPRIVKFETTAGLHMTLPFGHVVVGALRCLAVAAAKAKKCEYVILDFGPSASPLNMTWLSNVDFIMPCCFPDYFNVASMDGLLYSVLPSLLILRKEFVRLQSKAFTNRDIDWKENEFTEALRLPKRPPHLLPVVVTRYGIYSKRVTKHNSVWIVTLREYFKRNDVPKEVKNLFVPSGRGTPNETMVVCLLKDIGQTQQVSHSIGIPPPMLTKDGFSSHTAAWATAKVQKGRTRRTFSSLCNFIIAVRSDMHRKAAGTAVAP